MNGKKVRFFTGAGRRLAVDIARAALAAGNAVVSTTWNTEAVSKSVGQGEALSPVRDHLVIASKFGFKPAFDGEARKRCQLC